MSSPLARRNLDKLGEEPSKALRIAVRGADEKHPPAGSRQGVEVASGLGVFENAERIWLARNQQV